MKQLLKISATPATAYVQADRSTPQAAPAHQSVAPAANTQEIHTSTAARRPHLQPPTNRSITLSATTKRNRSNDLSEIVTSDK